MQPHDVDNRLITRTVTELKYSEGYAREHAEEDEGYNFPRNGDPEPAARLIYVYVDYYRNISRARFIPHARVDSLWSVVYETAEPRILRKLRRSTRSHVRRQSLAAARGKSSSGPRESRYFMDLYQRRRFPRCTYIPYQI